MAVASIDLPAALRPQAQAQAKASRARRIAHLTVYGLAALIVAVYVANVLWKMSGTNRWELAADRNGVKIYSLKAPGSSLKQFKAVMRARYSLNHLIAGLIENSNIDVCRRFIPACVDVQVVEPWSSKTMSDTVLWKLRFPAPFSPREVILQSQVAQDEATKKIVVDILAAPNKVARNKGTVRVTHIQNRWTYTPLGNNEVEIEFLQDADMGGLFPDFLQNLAGVSTTYQFIHDQLPALLDNEKLRQTHYDFIKD
jgi:hypothetical protein